MSFEAKAAGKTLIQCLAFEGALLLLFACFVGSIEGAIAVWAVLLAPISILFAPWVYRRHLAREEAR